MTARREKTALAKRKPRGAIGGGVLSRILQDVYSRAQISRRNNFSICSNRNIFFFFIQIEISFPAKGENNDCIDSRNYKNNLMIIIIFISNYHQLLINISIAKN